MIAALLGGASAGGYFYSDSGVVASSRGGAWIAGADNAFAQYYNPAGLIRVERPTVHLGVSLVQQRTRYAPVEGPEVHNDAPPFTVPQFGVAGPVSGSVCLAFGLVSPFAPSSSFPADGPQRYAVVDTSIAQFSWGPSLAWRVHPALTVGLGLQAKALRVEQSMVVSATGTTDPAGDIGVQLAVVDPFAPNVNAGVSLEIHPAATLGFAVQPPTAFRARGYAVLDLERGVFGPVVEGDVDRFQDGDCSPGQRDPVCAAEDGITVDLRLPLVLRAGVEIRPDPRVDIELAGVFQRWSSLDRIVLGDVDPELVVLGSPVELPDRFELPAGLVDTWSLRLGGGWRVREWFELRAGGFYENGATPVERITVALYDPWKVQVGGGASVWYGRFRVDAAAVRLFFPSLEVRESQARLIHLDVLGTGSVADTIGEGRYASMGWVVGAQLSAVLGRDP